MFKSITTAVLAHKQIVIAAIAITGLVVYAFPGNMLAAAQTLVDRTIEIPCLPYCNIAAPNPIDISTPAGDIHIEFSLVPIGT
jgi:hypothetical protein